MEEHVFGTYATDELKLAHHRAMRRGIQHWHQTEPRNPQPGDAVTLTVYVGPELDVTDMAVIYTTDGSIPQGSRGRAANGHILPCRRVEVMWDTLVWDYVEIWRVDLPAQPDGTTVRYRISAWAEGQDEICANWPDAELTVNMAAAAFFAEEPIPDLRPGDPSVGTVFTYAVDRVTPPDWARDMVMYQVFPDRFYPGDGRDWLQTDDVSGICGGTLNGITDKLGYLADLGITALWLTPIFPTPSHHGYDATDYRSIAPHLGTEDDFRRLVEAAHRRGMRVIMDLVCNHISNQHPVFVDALNNPDSPYRDWFTFDDRAPAGYLSFFGVEQMPQLNMQNQEARDWMIGHAEYWLREFDVDGYRLDYALGPGPAFWADFSVACKRIKPDSFVFGEIVDSPKAVQQYIGRLDGNLDFHAEAALRRTYAYGDWSEADFRRFLDRHYTYFPAEFLLPTFLDNHDTDRFLYVAGNNKDALRRAAAAQMDMPQPPVIYYGTEVGMTQENSKHGVGLEASRAVMLWGDDQDGDLLAYYREIIAARKARLAAGRSAQAKADS